MRIPVEERNGVDRESPFRIVGETHGPMRLEKEAIGLLAGMATEVLDRFKVCVVIERDWRQAEFTNLQRESRAWRRCVFWFSMWKA
jgi:hypothetical protein